LKVSIHTIVSEWTKAAAAANTGRQRDDGDRHHHQCREPRDAFDDLTAWRRLTHGFGNGDHQRRDGDHADGAGGQPVLPDDQDRHCRVLQQLVSRGPADAQRRRRGNGGDKEPQDAAQPADTEIRTEIALDQPGDQQGFAHVAQGERGRAPDIAIAHQSGGDGRDHRACGDGPLRSAPERDQHAGGNAGSRPEYGDAIGFGEEREAQARREKIGNADRNGEPCRADP
jgi:hypothetical protein